MTFLFLRVKIDSRNPAALTPHSSKVSDAPTSLLRKNPSEIERDIHGCTIFESSLNAPLGVVSVPVLVRGWFRAELVV